MPKRCVLSARPWTTVLRSLVCLTAVCILDVAVVEADPPAPPGAPAWGLQAGLFGKTTLPSDHFTYALAAGTAIRDAVVVYNFQPTPLTMHVYAADLLSAQGGGFAPAQAYQTMQTVGAWVHLSRSHLTIPPRSRVRLPFVVAVPHGVAPGDYYGAVIGAVRTGQGRNGIRIETRAALIVHLRVPGTVVIRVRLSPLNGMRQADGERWRLTVRNGSNVTVTTAGRVTVRDGRDRRPKTMPLAPAGVYVIPGGVTTLQAVWRNPPLFGQVSAMASLSISVNGALQRVYTSQPLTLTFVPWALLARALAGIAALGVCAALLVYKRQGILLRLHDWREERAVVHELRARKRTERLTGRYRE